jgi:hypothetical protein
LEKRWLRRRKGTRGRWPPLPPPKKKKKIYVHRASLLACNTHKLIFFCGEVILTNTDSNIDMYEVLEPLHPTRFEPSIFCYDGVDDGHYTTPPPGQGSKLYCPSEDPFWYSVGLGFKGHLSIYVLCVPSCTYVDINAVNVYSRQVFL